jgi:hypothetical protein
MGFLGVYRMITIVKKIHLWFFLFFLSFIALLWCHPMIIPELRAQVDKGAQSDKSVSGLINIHISTNPDGVDIYDNMGAYKGKSSKDYMEFDFKKDLILFAIDKSFEKETGKGSHRGFKNRVIKIPFGCFKEGDGYLKNGRTIYNYPKTGAIRLERWSFFEQHKAALIFTGILIIVAVTAAAPRVSKKIRLLQGTVKRRALTGKDLGETGELTGKILGGKYEIGDIIGKGGMAKVYQGWKVLTEENSDDRLINVPLAIKIILPHIAEEPDFRERFKREIECSQQLIYSNIVQGYDWGEDSEQNLLYIVMEMLKGQCLSNVIERNGSIDLSSALKWSIEILEGLGFAHRKGIIHRDLKPGNIFITESGHVKILDFGLAKKHDAKTVTKSGNFLGTPGYTSPEQAKGDAIDHRSDLYSCGVVLYVMLSGGSLPFEGKEMEIVLKSLAEDPVPLKNRKPDVPPSVERIIMKLMSKQPEDRYQNATEVIEALKRADHELGGGSYY